MYPLTYSFVLIFAIIFSMVYEALPEWMAVIIFYCLAATVVLLGLHFLFKAVLERDRQNVDWIRRVEEGQ